MQNMATIGLEKILSKLSDDENCQKRMLRMGIAEISTILGVPAASIASYYLTQHGIDAEEFLNSTYAVNVLLSTTAGTIVSNVAYYTTNKYLMIRLGEDITEYDKNNLKDAVTKGGLFGWTVKNFLHGSVRAFGGSAFLAQAITGVPSSVGRYYYMLPKHIKENLLERINYRGEII